MNPTQTLKQTMKISNPYHRGSPFQRWWTSRSFIQKRLIRFCLSMLVMVICFPLYYLGFFGSVDGPLNPSRIGETLGSMGVTRTHCMIMFLTFLIISASWNWIYNMVSMLMGSRLSCTKANVAGKPCGAHVKRTRTPDDQSNRFAARYVCTRGHERPDALFHPVKKGAVSHTVWLISLCFCIIVLVLGK